MRRLYISMYHYTRNLKNTRYPNIKGMDQDIFKKQIEFFIYNFNIVSMEQVIDALKNNSCLPEKALLLTFDDGYLDNFTVAYPILDEYNITASFFIPGKIISTGELLDVNKIHFILASGSIINIASDLKAKLDYYRGSEFDILPTEDYYNEYAAANRYDSKDVIFVKRMLQTVLPERLRKIISSELFSKYVGITEEQLASELYLTYEQIKTLKRHGMHIGIHGYDHNWLADLAPDELNNDILKALDVMDEFIDRDAWVMNYPYGNYNDRVIKNVKNLGSCIGLTTKVGICDLDKNDPFELPRFDCNDFPPKSEIYKTFI